MWTKKGRSKGGALDVTPLVDLVFLLIIFFLLSTTFRVAPGIRIDLPEAASQKIRTERKEIILTVDSSGSIYVNKDLVEPEVLSVRLAASALEDRNTTVLIKGDRNAGFGRMVDVLDRVKHAGLYRIAILTQKVKEQEKAGQGTGAN
jgi:biopolymer transport protein TolR